MQNKPPMTKQQNAWSKRDTLETDRVSSLSGFGSSLVKNVGQSFADIGTGIFDQITGVPGENESTWGNEQFPQRREQAPPPAQKIESKTLFNYRKIEEDRQIENLKQLIKQIQEEFKMLRREGADFLSEVKDIEKLTLESLPSKQGLYDISFMEIVLKILQALRSKIGESRTWMQALISKKKKRGSLFASRTKEKGTQYSLSQEMQATRSVQ